MADRRKDIDKRVKRVYQIWHDPGGHPSKMFEIRHAMPLPFPGGYVHVANVRASSLKEAAELATDNSNLRGNLESPFRLFTSWENKPGVETFKIPGMDRHRDLWDGDVIVSPGGQPYRYDEFEGFTAIPRQPDPAYGAQSQQRADTKGLEHRAAPLTRQIPVLLRAAIDRVSRFLQAKSTSSYSDRSLLITHPPLSPEPEMRVANDAAEAVSEGRHAGPTRAAPSDPTHRAQFQQRDEAKGLDR